jgi:uncharacterized protein YpmB
MELMIILFIILFILWMVWRVMAKNRAVHEAALDEAWHIVLSDPDYERRRQEEEARWRRDS